MSGLFFQANLTLKTGISVPESRLPIILSRVCYTLNRSQQNKGVAAHG